MHLSIMSIELHKMLIDLLFFVVTLALGVGGVSITHLSVPEIVDVGATAILTCRFNLQNQTLYSVKWYKDGGEFFRYMPTLHPETHYFKVEGVHLHPKLCNATTVTLQRVTFSSTGKYRCEVSTERPHFNTVFKDSNLTVLGIPKRDPIIEGIKGVYSVGEYVVGNCTSDKSYPPAYLEWYINGNKVENWQLLEYQDTADNSSETLRPSTLGVSFQADYNHFSGKGNTMHLKCVAKVKDIVRQAYFISNLADLEEKDAQGLRGSSGSIYSNVGRYYYVLVVIYFSVKS